VVVAKVGALQLDTQAIGAEDREQAAGIASRVRRALQGPGACEHPLRRAAREAEKALRMGLQLLEIS
jgi:hypothetical protein